MRALLVLSISTSLLVFTSFLEVFINRCFEGCFFLPKSLDILCVPLAGFHAAHGSSIYGVPLCVCCQLFCWKGFCCLCKRILPIFTLYFFRMWADEALLITVVYRFHRPTGRWSISLKALAASDHFHPSKEWDRVVFPFPICDQFRLGLTCCIRCVSKCFDVYGLCKVSLTPFAGGISPMVCAAAAAVLVGAAPHLTKTTLTW